MEQQQQNLYPGDRREPRDDDLPIKVIIRAWLDCSAAHGNLFNHNAEVIHQYDLSTPRQLQFFIDRCDGDLSQFGRLLAMMILDDL